MESGVAALRNFCSIDSNNTRYIAAALVAWCQLWTMFWMQHNSRRCR